MLRPLIPDDPAIMQSNDPVAETRRLRVMRHHEKCAAVFLLELVEKAKDLLSGGGVEIARGLIAQQQGRTKDQRARDGDSLALSAGEFIGTVRCPFFQPYALQHGRWRDVRPPFLRGLAGEAGRPRFREL